MAVIFARGTFEPGNVGVLVGPPFFDALKSTAKGKKVVSQGIAYGATAAGFLQGGDNAGAANFASAVTQAIQKCPNTKVVMSGYSQGGQLVHKAAARLPSATMQKVSSVVIFGDLDDGKAIAGLDQSKVKVFCHETDLICDGQDFIGPEHLDYAGDTASAAKFVVEQAVF